MTQSILDFAVPPYPVPPTPPPLPIVQALIAVSESGDGPLLLI